MTFVVIVGGLLFVSTLLQPFSGDLTRIGGLSEADFGWNIPQRRFYPPNYRQVPAIPQDGQSWDVVVFGDSFTDPDRDVASWLDILAARTGDMAIAVRYRSVDQIEAYLQSSAFRDRAPRLVIVESVTRNMAYRLASPNCRPEQHASVPNPGRAPETGLPRGSVEVQRRTEFLNITERLNVSSYFLRKSLVYTVMPQVSPVRAYSLTRADLFSARSADQVLYYVSDVEGQRVPAEQVQSFVCTVVRLRHATVANGMTRFLMIPAPDKSVAYAPFAQEPEFVTPGGYAALQAALGADLVDTLPPLQQAIESGVKDVYLPNDSHWGFDGARIVADAVLAQLERAPDSGESGARATAIAVAERP